MTGHPARLGALLTALALTTVACGGAEPGPAKAPAHERVRESKEDEAAASEPRTIEEAEAQIAQAHAALDARKDEKATVESTPWTKRPEAPTAPQGGAALREEREDACRSSCRALASMKRAVEALCRMTGDSDNRCVDARRTLGESTSRVSSCRC